MGVFEYAKQIKDLMGSSMGVNAHTRELWEMADFILQKQWNCREPPENEKPVLVIVERTYLARGPIRSVIRAFYEDGKLPAGVSEYYWDIDDSAMVPQGWYEISDYGDGSYEIDDPVIGWQPLPDPWE